MKIVVVDICGTIYQSNTTFDFFGLMSKDDKKVRLFYFFSRSLAWRLFNKFIWILSGYDLTRIILVCFLNGYSKKDLLDKADRFYTSFLLKHQNESVIELLRSYNDSDDVECVLASATLDFIAETISKYTGYNLDVSTKLLYKDGICKGRIKEDALGKKKEKLSIKIPFWKLITDDLSDVPLLTCCEEPIIVIYPHRKKKWMKIANKMSLQPQMIMMDKNY